MSERSAPFRAVLFPHRSLSRRGFFIVVAGVALIMGIAAARALAIGAWPVAVFAVADIALVWGAFHLSYRAARGFEEVSVDPREVTVKKVTPAGHATWHSFQTAWARLAVTREEDIGVTRLTLGAHGRSVVLGAFLNPGDRESFADAFAAALRRARGRG